MREGWDFDLCGILRKNIQCKLIAAKGGDAKPIHPCFMFFPVKFFREHGFDVMTCREPRKAIGIFSRFKPDAVLLHPLPRRKEIAVEVDADPRAVYWRQVRNGMWVRAALMLTIFDRGGEIDRYYEDLVS